MGNEQGLVPAGESLPMTVTAADFTLALEDAQQKAAIMKNVVEQAKLYATISGRQYLTVEAWQVIGRAYGLSWRVVKTEELPESGWMAHCVVAAPDGRIIAEGDAEAGTIGDNPWATRPRYQQRSMAQTRAVSKALRSALSWVVVLAGYQPTPADEMPREDDAPQVERTISEAQQKRLFAIARQHGVSNDLIRDYIDAQFGLEHTADLNRQQYEQLCAWLAPESE
jgi:hypothetical protein